MPQPLKKETMPKLLKKQRKIQLPYWPSQAFIKESIKMLREKGLNGSNEDMKEMVMQAYRKRRSEILAKQEMDTYEG